MGSARLTVITPECIRLEYSPTGVFVDEPSLFARERNGPTAGAHIIEDGAAPFELNTGTLVLRYAPDGAGFSADNLSIEVAGSGVAWRPGMRNERNLGGTLETLDRVRGRVPLPDGLLSRDGWYLFDDSTTHLLVDGWAAPRPDRVRGNTDWYFFGYGTDYRGALKALAAVAGPAPLPRRYALGSWYSRFWPYTSAEYREIVGEYDRRGYPLDVIVMDMDWHKPGWTGWSWNRDLLPDAEELLEWFHKHGLAVTLNLHPALGVGPHEDQYAPFMRAIGRDPATGETAPFDAGDRRYMEALFECIHAPLEGQRGGGAKGQREGETESQFSPRGVDFWWVDWQQDRFTRSIPDLSNLRWLNYLYFQHTARHGRRGCAFSRWAGWGDHRHPVHFSGDAHTGWDSLAFQVSFTATAGNVGCFFWSHDIGGHFGPRLEEATTRWVQFGALSPVLRLHSARSGALDRRPWTYKPIFEEAMLKAFQLRAELFPYIYSMTRKCHTEMLPLCRPMYIDWPNEEAAYENPQEYMLGDSLLAAPITSPGAGPRKVATQAVWFPGGGGGRRGARGEGAGGGDRGLAPIGSDWYNWFTGERYGAGDERIVAAEIDEIPMFVRGGVPIVTRGEPTLRMATAPLDKIVIACYPGEPGSYHEFELYEDDGITDAHARGEYSITPVRVWWFENEVKVEVGIRVGSFDGMLETREVELELRGVERVSHARVDDRWIGSIEGAGGRVRITGGRLAGAEVMRFSARFDAEHHEAARMRETDRRVGALVGNKAWQEVGLHACVSSLTPDEHLTLLGLLGTGFRLQDDTLHMYLATGAKKTLEDTLGRRVVKRVEIVDPPEPGYHQRWRLPEFTIKPALGLTARRAIVYEAEGAVQPGKILLMQQTAHLRSFRVAGPFRYDPTKPMSEQRHGPELLEAADRVRETFVDKSAKLTTWTECPANDYWPQDVHQVCGGHDGEAMAYLLTHVWSPEEQEVTFILESGDRIELWVDDARVFSSDTAAESDTGVDLAHATLKKGWNQIMAKTNEGGGGWGVRVSIDGKFELRESFEAR